ncbi:acyl carrier protein [Streptomyces sp. NBC_01537]|uniref:acyl carrier protein n=1 Tax=Streptomyces sp. NBC_01537 TaxID=2903896 RepID=UPI00386BEEFB
MEQNEILENILEFLAKMPGWRGEVTADTQVLDTGQLDSLGIITLMSYIEDSLKVSIPESEFRFERFSTPRSIADLVQENSDGPVVA